MIRSRFQRVTRLAISLLFYQSLEIASRDSRAWEFQHLRLGQNDLVVKIIKRRGFRFDTVTFPDVNF